MQCSAFGAKYYATTHFGGMDSNEQCVCACTCAFVRVCVCAYVCSCTVQVCFVFNGLF